MKRETLTQRLFNPYVNRFAYVAASAAWGIRIKDEVWIDTRRSIMQDLYKLIECFTSVEAGPINFAQPMKIKFQCCGRHPDYPVTNNTSYVKWYNHCIRFRWYATQHLSGSENSKWTISFDIREWHSVCGGYQTTRIINVPHHKGKFSNKELVKLLLKHLI